MNRNLLSLGAVWLLPCVAAFATEDNPPTAQPVPPGKIEYGFDANGNFSLKWSADPLSKKHNGFKLADLINTKLLPQVRADAAAGREPAIWDVGFFELQGWGGQRDLPKADAALRLGLSRQQLYLVGSAVTLARAYIHNWWKEPEAGVVERLSALFGGSEGNLPAAESLLDAIAAVVPEHPLYEMARGELLLKQKRYAEAESAFAKALPKLAQLKGTEKECWLILSYRFQCALKSGDFSAITPDEVLSIISWPSRELGRWIWAVPGILGLALAGLLTWTWRRRVQGPGIFLTLCWVALGSLASGLGFMVPLRGFDHYLGRWYGALALAAAAALAVMSARERYFGSGSLFAFPRGGWRTVGLLAGLGVGSFVFDNAYGWLYERATGHALPLQAVLLLLKAETVGQLAVTLLVAGVLVPFYEEVFFRGFLFDAFQRRWGVAWALFGSAAVFGLVHGLAVSPAIFVSGVALGWLRWRRGDLRACWALHALNNCLAVMALWFGQQ